MNSIPKQLYRFFSVPDRDIETLKEGMVFYPEPSQLNDPFDCQITINTNISKIPKEMRFWYIRYMSYLVNQQTDDTLKFSTDEDWSFQHRFDFLCEDFLTSMFRYGIHSLTENINNQLMWSHYASAYKGFAIGYDTSKPVDKNVTNSTWKVKYQEKIPQFDIVTLLNSENDWKRMKKELLSVKGKIWSYENEWRMIIWPGGRKERIPYLIDEIIFGHMLEDKYCEQLRELFGSKVNYKVAIPSENRYEVELKDANNGRRRIEGIARPHRKRFTYFYNKK
jgi:hypothetical protein